MNPVGQLLLPSDILIFATWIQSRSPQLSWSMATGQVGINVALERFLDFGKIQFMIRRATICGMHRILSC